MFDIYKHCTKYDDRLSTMDIEYNSTYPD